MLPSQFKRFTDESQPLVIDPEVAAKIGLNESIIIRQLHFWLKINEKAGKNIFDGKVWCYNSIREWKEKDFIFWSESTISRTFSELHKLNLIETISNPKNKWNKTKWYTINYAEYAKLFAENIDQIDLVNMTESIESDCTDGDSQNDQMNNKTEITTEITTENIKEKKFNAETYLKNLDLDSEIKSNLKSWLEIRKAKKTPTTQTAIDLNLKKLIQCSKQTQIEMIQNSIMNGWIGIFELNQNKHYSQKKPPGTALDQYANIKTTYI
jgi:hypothetical protein